MESRVISEAWWSSLCSKGNGGTSSRRWSSSTLSEMLAVRLLLLLCRRLSLLSSFDSSRDSWCLSAAAVNPAAPRPITAASRVDCPSLSLLLLRCDLSSSLETETLRSETEPLRLDRRSPLRLECPDRTVPGSSPSRFKTTFGLLPWIWGALEDLETRLREWSRELVESTVS